MKDKKIPQIEGKKILITIDKDDAYHVTAEQGISGVDMLKAATTLIDCIITKNDTIDKKSD